MRGTRKDANQHELTGYLEQCGWHVIDTAAVGPNAVPGFPDALACSGGVIIGVEFKVGRAGLTHSEDGFWREHSHAFPLVIVRDTDDVLEMTREYLAGRL